MYMDSSTPRVAGDKARIASPYMPRLRLIRSRKRKYRTVKGKAIRSGKRRYRPVLKRIGKYLMYWCHYHRPFVLKSLGCSSDASMHSVVFI